MQRSVNVLPLFLVIGLMILGCGARREAPRVEAPAEFTQGVLRADFRADSLNTFNAAWAALNDFNMKINNSKRDATGGFIEAIQPDGTGVNLQLRAKEPETTTVAIQVGPQGDEELSRAISRRISAHLR
jgi:hypothetical protein